MVNCRLEIWSFCKGCCADYSICMICFFSFKYYKTDCNLFTGGQMDGKGCFESTDKGCDTDEN